MKNEVWMVEYEYRSLPPIPCDMNDWLETHKDWKSDGVSLLIRIAGTDMYVADGCVHTPDDYETLDHTGSLYHNFQLTYIGKF